MSLVVMSDGRDDKKRRVIFATDSGAVKMNSPFSAKLKMEVMGKKLSLPLFEGSEMVFCAVSVKTEADAELLKSKLLEYFA